MEPVAFVFTLLGLTLVALVTFLIAYNAKQKKIKRETQRLVSDKQLLQLIAKQPDGILGVHELAEQTELTKKEAYTRLLALAQHGITVTSMSQTSKGGKYFFELREPLDEREAPELSPEPFLTVDDILRLFEAFDYQLDPQKMILATGLPLKIIDREMKYFQKEGVVRILYRAHGGSTSWGRKYYLEEPYRSDPQRFLNREKEMNEKVRELLRDDLML